METITINCVACGKEHTVKRSLMKGYKISPEGCLCDDCFDERYTAKVYRYGCGSEYHGGYAGTEIAIAQMKLMNQLWNALAEIDNWSRTEYRRLTTDPAIEAAIKPLEERREHINELIQKQKQQERKKKIVIDPVLKTELASIKAQLGRSNDVIDQQTGEIKLYASGLYAALKKARDAMKTANESAIGQLREDTLAKIEHATTPSVCGLLYTNIAAVKSSFDTASSRAKKDSTMLHPRRFDGTGRIVVPFPKVGGLPLADAFRDDEVGKFQMAKGLMSVHPREKRTSCRIAVATERKKPIWLTLPVVFHQPLPPNAEIRQVVATRDLIAGKAKWELHITVRIRKPLFTAFSDVAVGINVGYRKVPEGLRVAYWYDQQGNHEQVVISNGDLSQFEKITDLDSIMKLHFNQIVGELRTWLATNPALSQPVADAFKDIANWKSPRALVLAMQIWKDNRFDGDTQMWDAVLYWRNGPAVKPNSEWNGHWHLYQWRCNLNEQIQLRRLEQYRKFAATFAKKYNRVFIDEFDLRDVTEKPEPEQDVNYDSAVRRQRTIAALSILRGAIENVCQREGLTYKKINASFVTQDCHLCGHRNTFDAAKSIVQTCAGCGLSWDQDENAARNILKRGLDSDSTGRVMAQGA